MGDLFGCVLLTSYCRYVLVLVQASWSKQPQ